MAAFEQSQNASQVINSSKDTSSNSTLDCANGVYNETLGQCVTQDGGGALSFFTDPFIAGSIILVLLAAVYIFGVKRGKSGVEDDGKDEYDATLMEKRVDQKITNPTDDFGFNLGKKLYLQDGAFKKKMGNIEKFERRTEAVATKTSSNGKVKEFENRDVVNIVLGPEGFMSNFMANLGPSNPRKNGMKTFMAGVPLQVEDSDGNMQDVFQDNGDHMVMQKLDMEEVSNAPGLYRISDNIGFQHVKESVTSSFADDSLATFSNLAENTQALNIKNTAAWKFFREKMGAIGDYKDRQNEEQQLNSSD